MNKIATTTPTPAPAQSNGPTPPATSPPKKRRIRSASVVAIDRVSFILSDLPAETRRQVLAWMNAEYGEKPSPVAPKE